MQKGAREAFKANMRERLAKKPWIADHRELESLTASLVLISVPND